jgi:hypothetical protein
MTDEGNQHYQSALQAGVGGALADRKPNPQWPEQHLEQSKERYLLGREVAGCAHHQHTRQAELCHAEYRKQAQVPRGDLERPCQWQSAHTGQERADCDGRHQIDLGTPFF